MKQACTFDRFQRDVTYHWMDVVRDDGADRLIRFKRSGSSTYWFDLITWPGCLCISSDCGTYVFSRVSDMFTFFRSEKEGDINPQYWAEKVKSADRDGVQRYSAEAFRENVERWLSDWIEENPFRDDQGKFTAGEAELRKDVRWEVLGKADEGEYAAIQAALDFEWKGERLFPEFYETSSKEYTFSYLWCCFAIVWGIRQYDAHKAGQALKTYNSLAKYAGMAVAA